MLIIMWVLLKGVLTGSTDVVVFTHPATIINAKKLQLSNQMSVYITREIINNEKYTMIQIVYSVNFKFRYFFLKLGRKYIFKILK